MVPVVLPLTVPLQVSVPAPHDIGNIALTANSAAVEGRIRLHNNGARATIKIVVLWERLIAGTQRQHRRDTDNTQKPV
jgi:hypothetical protein